MRQSAPEVELIWDVLDAALGETHEFGRDSRVATFVLEEAWEMKRNCRKAKPIFRSVLMI